MEHTTDNERGPETVGEAQREQADAARREVLTKIGRFVYVAPALALLAQPRGAQAGYGRGDSKPGWGFGDKNHKGSGPSGPKKNHKDSKPSGPKKNQKHSGPGRKKNKLSGLGRKNKLSGPGLKKNYKLSRVLRLKKK